MRFTVEVAGFTLDLTFGPTDEPDDEPEPLHVVVDTLSADLTHGGHPGIGFTATPGPDHYADE